MKNVWELEEAGDGVLLEIAQIVLDIGEAPEVVLQRVQLERGEAFLSKLVGL